MTKLAVLLPRLKALLSPPSPYLRCSAYIGFAQSIRIYIILHTICSVLIYNFIIKVDTEHLEAQFCEEPSVLSTLELLLQDSLGLFVGFSALGAIFKTFMGDHILQIGFKGVTSWHHVLVVHNLCECLEAGAASLFQLRGFFDDLQRAISPSIVS